MDYENQLLKLDKKLKIYLNRESVFTNLPEEIINEYIDCIEGITNKSFDKLSPEECSKFRYINQIADVRIARFNKKMFTNTELSSDDIDFF